jgi:hypothetical protein
MQKAKTKSKLVLRRHSIRVLTESEAKCIGGGMCNTVTCSPPPPCCDAKTELLNPFTH